VGCASVRSRQSLVQGCASVPPDALVSFSSGMCECQELWDVRVSGVDSALIINEIMSYR
jgi:hypothetical protein